MEFDRNGLTVLDEADCYRHLGRSGIGRVAVSVGALPAIFPVNYALHAGRIYFRTAPGTKLTAATQNAVIAFEVDRYDKFAHTGWSVLVIGRSDVITDSDELDELQTLPLARWARRGEASLVRLEPELISGRAMETIDLINNGSERPSHA